jgi:hypothetical protein
VGNSYLAEREEGEGKIMKKTAFAVSFALLLLLASMLALAPSTLAQQRGPRADLDIYWYLDPDSAWAALKAGDIDMMQWALSEEQLREAESDPNICVASYTENGMMEYDFNNNATIADYPTSTNPMSITEVRKALAYLIDPDYIISAILHYFGSRIDAPVCYPQIEGWVYDPASGKSVVTYDWNRNGRIDPEEDNYPYKYDPNATATILAQLGFSDTDGNHYLNYPNDPSVWGDAAGKDTTEMPLKICIRNEDERLDAGRYLYRQLEGDPAVAGDSILASQPAWAKLGKVGGDFDTTDETWVQPRKVLGPIVFRDRNYHIYTGGWSFGRYPTYLFFLFHSMFWYPYGPNYVSDHAHPDLDPILEDIWYAPDIPSAQAAAKEYTREHVLRVINRPLWSYTSYYAWRKTLAGVVNMKGYGTINDYTFLNAYRADNPGAPVRFGVVNTWDKLNILYSQWVFEYAFLDRVYTTLIAVNPYDLTVDTPWVAQDWDVGTWTDPRDGHEKTVVTYWLRPDAGCAAPVNGNFTGFFNSKDLEFTIWYNYAYDDSWQWGSFMDVHHTEIVDCRTIKVYFDDLSYWFQYSPTYPLLGPAEILSEMLCTVETATFAGTDLVEVSPGYFEYQFTTDQVAGVINATRNGNPIHEGVDFYIRAGYDVYSHNVFVNLTSFAPTDIITITYYKPIPGGADGTFLGGNAGYDWTDTMFAYGTYYPVAISSTGAALNRNPYFFLETPILGEIDWRWNWVAGPKPRKGYFKIDILDVVKCTGSYCHSGTGSFDPIYMPGADIDKNDLGHVGILDLVTITGVYAKTFGMVPAGVIGTVGGNIEVSGVDITNYYKIITTASYTYYIKYNMPLPVKRTYQYVGVYVPKAPGLTVTITYYPSCFTPRDSLTMWEKWGSGTLNIGTNSVTMSATSPTCYGVNIRWHKPDCTWESLLMYINFV